MAITPSRDPRDRVFDSCTHGDFSNLQSLVDLLAQTDGVVCPAGTGRIDHIAIDPAEFYPHMSIVSDSSRFAYEFVKLDDRTYLLKVLGSVESK